MQMNPYTDRNRPNRSLVRFAGLRRTDSAFGRAEMCAEKARPGYYAMISCFTFGSGFMD
jgi:hypothetical protein